MIRSKCDLNSFLIKPKVSFQDNCVRSGRTAPTILMMKQWAKDQLNWIRVPAHGTEHDPKHRNKYFVGGEGDHSYITQKQIFHGW